jgi:hypothetical protein
MLMYLAGGRQRSEDQKSDDNYSDIPQSGSPSSPGTPERNGYCDIPQAATTLDAARIAWDLDTDVERGAGSSSRFDMDTGITPGAPEPDFLEDSVSDWEESASHNSSSGVQPYRFATRCASRSYGEARALAKPSESDFIRTLLRYQQFDGSIDFGKWFIAENVLGSDITAALWALAQGYPDDEAKTIWTAAAHVLLERDCQSSKSLWELMAIKLARYCWGRPWASGFRMDPLEVVKKVLEGLKLPIHQDHKEETKMRGSPVTVAGVDLQTAVPFFVANRDPKKDLKELAEKHPKTREEDPEEKVAATVEPKKKARSSLWDRLRAPRRSEREGDVQSDAQKPRERSSESKRKSVVDDTGGKDDASLEGSTESGAASERSSAIVDTEMEDVLDEQPEAEPVRPVV